MAAFGINVVEHLDPRKRYVIPKQKTCSYLQGRRFSNKITFFFPISISLLSHLYSRKDETTKRILIESDHSFYFPYHLLFQ
jgi:hypothetical protein